MGKLKNVRLSLYICSFIHLNLSFFIFHLFTCFYAAVLPYTGGAVPCALQGH